MDTRTRTCGTRIRVTRVTYRPRETVYAIPEGVTVTLMVIGVYRVGGIYVYVWCTYRTLLRGSVDPDTKTCVFV